MALLDKVRQTLQKVGNKLDQNQDKPGFQLLPPVSFNKPNLQPVKSFGPFSFPTTQAIQSKPYQNVLSIAKQTLPNVLPAIKNDLNRANFGKATPIVTAIPKFMFNLTGNRAQVIGERTLSGLEGVSTATNNTLPTSQRIMGGVQAGLGGLGAGLGMTLGGAKAEALLGVPIAGAKTLSQAFTKNKMTIGDNLLKGVTGQDSLGSSVNPITRKVFGDKGGDIASQAIDVVNMILGVYKGGKYDPQTKYLQSIETLPENFNIPRFLKQNTPLKGFEPTQYKDDFSPVTELKMAIPDKQIPIIARIVDDSKVNKLVSDADIKDVNAMASRFLSDKNLSKMTPEMKIAELYKHAVGSKVQTFASEIDTPKLSVEPTTPTNTKQIEQPLALQTKTSEALSPSLTQPTSSQTLPSSQTQSVNQKLSQPLESIISNAKKEIGGIKDEPKTSLKKLAEDTYTQWVDRFNPITKASDQAKATLKTQGAMLRPENDPTYLVRRLTGAGGIADTRYKTELKPIIDTMDSLKIDKGDLDVYLKARRDLGLSDRGIIGSDKGLAQQRIQALEAKYGQNITGVAQKLYDYQNKGFQEMVDAGFISPDVAKTIKSQNPDYVPFQRVMDEMNNYLGVPTNKTMQGSQPISKIKGSERQVYSPVESVIANTFTQRAAIEKNAVAKSIVELQKIAPELGFSKVSNSAPDTITIWNNGNKEYWKVGTDIADTAKGLNEENMNALLKIFQAPASLLRQGATGRNPEFMLPNIIRDQLEAGVTSKYGYIPFVDYVSGLKSMLGNDEIYQKWANSGAKMDLGEMSGRKTIADSFNATKAKQGLFSWIGKGLDVMGKYSEEPTRVGLYKKAYQKTGNDLLSMMESRDSTLDFSRMGSKMKVANSIVPFLNVGVQGFDKIIRAVKDNPGKVALNAGIFAALPTITTVLYNLTQHPQEYAEIPQFVKDNNFILVKGRNEQGTVDYVAIPKGNLIQTISNPIQSFLEFASGQSQQSLSQFATQFISSTLPVIGEGSTLKEVATKTIGQNLPQLIKPTAENLLNKSFFKYDQNKQESKNIVPLGMQSKEPYQQSYDWTPSSYKAIGSALNVSPLKVQNFLEGYLAGYTKIPSQIIDNLKAVSEGKPVDNNNKTLIRRFLQTTNPPSDYVAPEKPPTTPFMERITGKAGASEFGVPTYTKSKDSPSGLLQRAGLYGSSLVNDHKATVNAVVTGQPIRKLRGGTVILERQNGLGSMDKGNQATEVDHIIPLSLGGTNDKSNLQILTYGENMAKGTLETYLADQLGKKKITKQQAQEMDKNWRTEINNLPPNLKTKATNFLSSPAPTQTLSSAKQKQITSIAKSSLTKEKAQVESQYQLDYSRLSSAKDTEGIKKLNTEYVAYLKEYQSKLDPETDQTQITNLQKKIETTQKKTLKTLKAKKTKAFKPTKFKTLKLKAPKKIKTKKLTLKDLYKKPIPR